jgi:hypothetical protein
MTEALVRRKRLEAVVDARQLARRSTGNTPVPAKAPAPPDFDDDVTGILEVALDRLAKARKDGQEAVCATLKTLAEPEPAK